METNQNQTQPTYPTKYGENPKFDKWMNIMQLEWIGKGVIGDSRGQILAKNVNPDLYKNL
jgi:hypothetical protein